MATTDEYFDQRWGHSDDPWEQDGRASELRKFDLTAALPRRPRAARAFEPASATGLLTERLARRCDELVCGDRDERAVAASTRRLAGVPNIRLGHWRIPDQWPKGRFDLIVLSEVLYYLDPAEVGRCLDLTVDSLLPDGDLVVVHYRPVVAEHELTGDEVHDIVGARPDLTRFARHVEEDFVLEGFGLR